MTVDNVTMDTDRDGIDIDCCQNTTVSKCRINSPHYDGLCPKSSYVLGETRITENLKIINCQVSGFKQGTLFDGTMIPANGCGRINLGTESNGGFHNVTIADCTFLDCYGLALEEVDGGILENVTVNNITMTDVVKCPMYIALGSRDRGPGIVDMASLLVPAGIGKTKLVMRFIPPASAKPVGGVVDAPTRFHREITCHDDIAGRIDHVHALCGGIQLRDRAWRVRRIEPGLGKYRGVIIQTDVNTCCDGGVQMAIEMAFTSPSLPVHFSQ